MSRSTPTNITLPKKVQEDSDKQFVEPLEPEKFFGRPSRSMVIRALLEIALEHAAHFDPSKVHDYEGLKRELRRILEKDSSTGG